MKVDSLLKEIWISHKCNDLPAFYSTDNVAKDKYLVADSFADIRRAQQILGLTTGPLIEIHQDIFHARERVARTLHRRHPDYCDALAGLKKVFGRPVLKTFLRNDTISMCGAWHAALRLAIADYTFHNLCTLLYTCALLCSAIGYQQVCCSYSYRRMCFIGIVYFTHSCILHSCIPICILQ